MRLIQQRDLQLQAFYFARHGVAEHFQPEPKFIITIQTNSVRNP